MDYKLEQALDREIRARFRIRQEFFDLWRDIAYLEPRVRLSHCGFFALRLGWTSPSADGVATPHVRGTAKG
jgi:hypothetical protein